MTDAPASLDLPQPCPDDEADEAPPSRERRLKMLDRLAEAGMELVEALVAQGKGTGPKVVDGDVGLAFSRVSRGVRLAILLQEQLSGAREDPLEAARQAEAQHKKAHIARAVRIVERVATDHCQVKPSRIGDYAYAARERLDDDDIYGLVASRPVGELVALICRDFGLQPNWDALAEEAWAQAEIASGAEGSPFLEDWDEEDDEDDEAPERCATAVEYQARPPPQGGGGGPEGRRGHAVAMRNAPSVTS